MEVSPVSNASGSSPGPKPTLREMLLEGDRFVTIAEVASWRGIVTEEAERRPLETARALAGHPRIDALSVTDNAGGHAMLAPEALAVELQARGQNVIVHVACRDRNRNALLSRAWTLASEGLDDVLAVTGDYPTDGYRGLAGPVFDIDSVGLLRMLSDLNAGLPAPPIGSRPDRATMPTRFFAGAVVNNHKRHEREVVPQYLKLARKIANGARFIVTQVGYDARKDDELLHWMARSGLQVPVVANVYVLGRVPARLFHEGRIPGCVVTDELMALVERQGAAPDKGRAFFLELAAKQVAIARGLGYRGAYIGGYLKPDDYDRILGLADSFGPDDWRELAREIRFAQPGEFHYFEEDPATGLSSMEVNREYARSRSAEARRDARRTAPATYRVSRFLHETVFEPGTPGFRAGEALYRTLERRSGAAAGGRGRLLDQALHAAENVAKLPLYDCRDCGDCSLPDVAYLCPESQCAKNERNGPCGGSFDGQCEVGDKECMWARAYVRLKAYGEEDRMLERPVVTRDSALRRTSAWANTFLGRDHFAAVPTRRRRLRRVRPA